MAVGVLAVGLAVTVEVLVVVPFLVGGDVQDNVGCCCCCSGVGVRGDCGRLFLHVDFVVGGCVNVACANILGIPAATAAATATASPSFVFVVWPLMRRESWCGRPPTFVERRGDVRHGDDKGPEEEEEEDTTTILLRETQSKRAERMENYGMAKDQISPLKSETQAFHRILFV